MGTVPLAIAVGAGAFALLATAVVRRMIRDGRLAQSRSSEQIASLRALVDDYEALLSSTGEVTVVWSGLRQRTYGRSTSRASRKPRLTRSTSPSNDRSSCSIEMTPS